MSDTTSDLRFPDAVVHFGVFFQGVNHSTVWSDPRSGSQLHPSTFTQLIRTAERGLFDAFFLGEGLRLREQHGRIHDLDIVGRPDALTELATLAGLTERIGLVATQNTTYNDPADLARRLASLDVLSGGRAAWNVVTTDNAWTGANFRRGGYLDHADRYERAERFVTLARRVWDSWDGEGFAPVTSTDRFFDVEITPTVPRSPQGHPVVFQAGDSPAGRDFAARSADVIFSRHGTRHDDALEFADDVRRRVVAAGRPEDDVLVLPGTQIVVADTEAEVEEKARWVLEQQVTPATALSLVGQVWGEDLSGYDPDGPLPTHDPVIAVVDGTRGAARQGHDPRAIAQRWRAVAEENKYSLRELVLHHSSERGFAGTASQLADELTHWVRSGACDGFNVTPYLVPSGLDDIVDQLVPALQDRGAYPTGYVGTTLREHLGLRPPLTRR
ncbi:FMN-dependent oxidoreductase (nitrilotriacetate monooxygenase family) [Kineococcus radiotolerans]|uniref:FMN-dependent oxidoreductase (Nitrilotriacetate monooxygenase family) n=1 Tax=Kineococcus radiotolerans TaxID=131568 RepID=A0A7W4TK47_KINRA|nr:NtaA/DmoA family FMN-dependent monooxygenase [Kineococcus radiotolerans]MBB2900389.1 FMN-dependent oxidoreductase (nitrilotriacetate monooxygenase family) [Kineococcus radiotolerans]